MSKVVDKNYDYQNDKLQQRQVLLLLSDYLSALKYLKENYSESLSEFTQNLFNPEKNTRYAYFQTFIRDIKNIADKIEYKLS